MQSQKQYHLLKIIPTFPQLLPQPPQNPIPHPLTNYIYHLPSPLHTFYNPHNVIDLENQTKTTPPLSLMKPTQITLPNALKLVALSPPQK
ncbi:DALR anticodon-binding domain-containing protein, partial [Bacillus sp. WP8]|uniref:DALR anticodon-binding domain-containing protein n=1 Tax=Bacillus sp. WP8 TaxID=756828 RepID=UPI0021B3ABEE